MRGVEVHASPMLPDGTADTSGEPFRFAVDVGTATPEQLAEVFGEMSKLYELMAGQSVVFTVPDKESGMQTNVTRNETGEYLLAIGGENHTLTEAEAAILYGQLQRWMAGASVGVPSAVPVVVGDRGILPPSDTVDSFCDAVDAVDRKLKSAAEHFSARALDELDKAIVAAPVLPTTTDTVIGEINEELGRPAAGKPTFEDRQINLGYALRDLGRTIRPIMWSCWLAASAGCLVLALVLWLLGIKG